MSVTNDIQTSESQDLEKISALNQRDELYTYLLKREGFERQTDYIIPLRDNHESLPPLSFAQERFWFLDQFEHAHTIYNGCKAVHLIGQLSIEVLQECLNLIVRRHEILRTTYPALDGKPIARIIFDSSIDIAITNLRDVSESELPYIIQELARKEWLQPINLSEELPIRAQLVRINDANNLLLLTLHQIASDSQSVAIFYRELWTAYEAKVHGRDPELPVLQIQYGDFASWQRRRVLIDGFKAHREFWRQQLSGPLQAMNLAADKPRPHVQSFDGSRLPIYLAQPLQQKLKALSRENGVTLFVTLLTAFKTLLYRYTAQTDVLVGSPMLNRGLPEIENLIGSFLNTLVLRTNYAGNPSFHDALRRVQETCRNAFAHQEFPFERLVEELQPQRKLGRNPIFQVMFAFQNTLAPELELLELRSKSVEVDSGMTKFDLTLSLVDSENEIGGNIEYSTDLFNRETVERMSGHFQRLIEGIVCDPAQSIATLPILTEAERRQILIEWNDTTAEYPKDKCIHQLFEEQVERTPQAVALEFEDKQITYRELNRKANQLAHHLISLGIGPEKLVGICVERSIEMVVGLLGVLKAGGAYVPLDPSYPKERLCFMLEDAQVAVLLTHEKLAEDRGWMNGDRHLLPSILDPRLEVVCLDRDWPIIEQQSTENPNSRVDSANLAYLIYTSGSTGQPKGVQIEHRSVVNCLSSIGTQISLAPHDSWLAVTTISFDIAALELYLPLISGAKLILANRDESIDAVQLLARIRASGATVIQATPSMWKLLFDSGWRRPGKSTILCGGEALSRPLADRLLDGADSVWNLYGPTETTIWSAMYRVEPGDRPVYIGRPIANTQIYILDNYLQPVPIGVHGDLYIGGDGVARGYLNRPELTAERFILNPFSDDPTARLYRTGDRARYRPGGNIEFLGRSDHQVKIRGHRIELGEVEAMLNQHPAVKECVIVARDRDSSGEKELIAYLLSAQDATVALTDLRCFLQEKLPDSMIPSMFVFLDGLPLTPNGKVDRNALPSPDGERPQLNQGFVETRTEIEELVAQVWREVLKLDKIGIHDNFFELGGHSLLATRVVARLRANFNIDLPLRKLFELPTVARLAAHIEIVRRHNRGLRIPRIVPVPRNRPIPLSFSQRRLWFLEKLDPGLPGYNMPAAYEIKGALNVSVLRRALNEVISRHESLRTRIVEADGHPYQEIVSALNITLPIVDLTHLSPPLASLEVERFAAEDAWAPFDLATVPLLRAKLLRWGENKHVLILNFHHIISDGSSVVVFFEELATLYGSFLDGKPSPLTPLPIQYADYSVWQNEMLQSPEIDLQFQYWRKQLELCPSSLHLPVDYRRPSVTSYRGAKQSVELSEELTRRIKEISRQEGVTIFMTLLAVFYLLLSRHSGQRDLVVGATVAGRNQPEIERSIGFFINVLPLRANIPTDVTFLKFLQQVRETCLDAYTHQDLPFERIIEEVKPEREFSRQPLIQVLFNLADISERRLTLPGCNVAKLAPAALAAKYDIVLSAPELDGNIQLNMVYNPELFSESRIIAMLRQFEFLLSQISSNLTERLDRLSLISPSSFAMLPDPAKALGETWHGPVYNTVARHGSTTPDHLAIVDANGCWTYAEVDKHSRRITAYLADMGIQPQDVVAVYAHRSASLVPVLLGTLNTGAVFIILDPAYPAARLTEYLRIARPRGFIEMAGAGKPADELTSYMDTLELRCRMILPNTKTEMANLLRDYSPHQRAPEILADDPAYLAFTSGSTGEPKAVLCRHGPMTHFLPWQEKTFDLRSDDRFSLLSGLAYNYLQREIFTALWLGATVYIPEPDLVKSPAQLAPWLRENKITVLHLTPAFAELLGTVASERLTSVRRIFCGGDVLTKHTLAVLRKVAPNAKVTNLYGATETQRASGYFEVPEEFFTEDKNAKEIIPLGQGALNVQLLLLTPNRRMAGIGEVGELFIRSPHLALGYLNDEHLTREKFLLNPFGTKGTDRMFHTGEMGRYLPNGDVERVGRGDRQVSIRGFRVELEEIETVLKQHPVVADAAVMMRSFETPSAVNLASGSKPYEHLTAYIVSNEDDSQSLRDLVHSYTEARLPEYMVPSHFIVLPRLPLNPNGKVDYHALSAIPLSEGESTMASAAPPSPVEAKVCDILAEVLGRTAVAKDENFFRLGGHSLLAVQAVVRIKESFGVSVDLRTFIDEPTGAALAREVDVRLKAKSAEFVAQDNTDREEIEL
jgi:amino acid adenylation domain-containing protein